MNEPTNVAIRVSSLLTARSIVGLLLPTALLLSFALPTFLSLHETWTTNYYYTHGYLVLALTAMLVVLEVRRAPLAPASPSWTGFACLVSLVLVAMAARAMTIETLAAVALPLYFVAATWALAGWSNARRFVLPVGYLFVAIPIWGVFVPPLQSLTVRVVSAWIRSFGLPAFIEGNLIHVPSGTFEVMEGCAGLRYALVAFALTTLLGLVSYRRWAPTALLTLSALALVAVANWLRVFTTVAVGFAPGTVAARLVRDNHNLFGWIVFVVFLIPLVYLHRKLEAKALQQPPTDVRGGNRQPWVPSASGVAYVTCASLAVAIYFTFAASRLDRVSVGTGVFEAPEVAGWTRAARWQDSRAPSFNAASVQGGVWYTDGEARVGAYVGGYAAQEQGREVVSLDNVPAGEFGVATARRSVTVQSESGSSIPFREFDVSEPGNERRLVWIGLRIAGRFAASDVVAKLFQLRGAIDGRRDAQALVLTASCESDCTEARSRLSRFAASAAELLYAQAERSVTVRRGSPGADHVAGL